MRGGGEDKKKNGRFSGLSIMSLTLAYIRKSVPEPYFDIAGHVGLRRNGFYLWKMHWFFFSS